LCGIVFAACFTAGRVIGRHRLSVAFVAPLALVVADTAVSVEIAVLLARRGLHGHHARAQAVLVVVARAQAIRIECIDDAVAVVISTVAALKKLVSALRLQTRRRAALVRGNAAVARAATELQRAASTRACATDQRIVDANFDYLSAARQQLRDNARTDAKKGDGTKRSAKTKSTTHGPASAYAETRTPETPSRMLRRAAQPHWLGPVGVAPESR